MQAASQAWTGMFRKMSETRNYFVVAE